VHPNALGDPFSSAERKIFRNALRVLETLSAVPKEQWRQFEKIHIKEEICISIESPYVFICWVKINKICEKV
jgi:hypothetical protein